MTTPDSASEPARNQTGPGSPRGPGGILGWFRQADKKILVGVIGVVLVIGVLMGTQLRNAMTYYITVDELRAKGDSAYDNRIRVGGRVVGGTIQKDVSNNLSFVMYHDQPADTLPVRYKGIVPDLFGDDRDVIVEGIWRKDGVFYATNLLAQHPPEFKVAQPGQPHPTVTNRGPYTGPNPG